jgi:hypothetical protein
MASTQLWNTRHIVAVLVALYDNAELAFADLSHLKSMAENGPARNAAERLNSQMAAHRERSDYQLMSGRHSVKRWVRTFVI